MEQEKLGEGLTGADKGQQDLVSTDICRSIADFMCQEITIWSLILVFLTALTFWTTGVWLPWISAAHLLCAAVPLEYLQQQRSLSLANFINNVTKKIVGQPHLLPEIVILMLMWPWVVTFQWNTLTPSSLLILVPAFIIANIALTRIKAILNRHWDEVIKEKLDSKMENREPENPDEFRERDEPDTDEEYYNFQHKKRGLCLIFNQKIFEEELNLAIRYGTEKDRDDCLALFNMLRFNVKVYNDLTVSEIGEKIEKAADESHEDSDCIAVIILTHGEADMLYGHDGQFEADDLIDKFRGNECMSLAGKPKFFFIQSCRGGELDGGVQVATDNNSTSYKIPTTSDFLICWATYKGQKSLRSCKNGTWFIQSLVQLLTSQVYNDDLISLMTKVNRYLIKNYQAGEDMNEAKQTATIVSTLMKKVKFNR